MKKEQEKWNEVRKVKKDVDRCIQVLTKYPLLTFRKKDQLSYLLLTKENNSWDYHLKHRNLKYKTKETNISYTYLNYFPMWLSGFTEAEGSFRIKPRSFYIFSKQR